MELARSYFERSAAIDGQATVLGHLVQTGIFLRDTSLLRRAWPVLDRTEDAPKWMFGWLAAATTGDAALLASLRQRPVHAASDPSALQGAYAAYGAVVPARLLDEMFERWIGAIGDDGPRSLVQAARGFALAGLGRPAAAERVWAGLPAAAAVGAYEARLVLALAGDGAGLDTEGALRRMATAGAGSGPEAERAACLAELWRRVQGDSARADAGRFRQSQARCARALDAVALGFSRAPDADSALAAVDSIVYNASATTSAELFEGLALAHAWERRGNARRAAAAVRYGIATDPGRRMDGRLSALAGDTVTAVYAYRRWLALTADAEPAVQAARESVRAELDRLTGQ